MLKKHVNEIYKNIFSQVLEIGYAGSIKFNINITDFLCIGGKQRMDVFIDA